MIFYGIVAKRLPNLQKMPGQLGEQLAVFKHTCFQLSPLLLAQPHVGVLKYKLIKLCGQEKKPLPPLHQWIPLPGVRDGKKGRQQVSGLNCLCREPVKGFVLDHLPGQVAEPAFGLVLAVIFLYCTCDAQNFVKIRLSKHPKFEDVGR